MAFRSDSPVLSSNNLAAQLNRHLPIYVTSDVIQTHPKLGLLLEDIAQKLTSNSLKKETCQNLNAAATSTRQERQNYLEQSALRYYSVVASKADDASQCIRQFEDGLAMSTLAVSLQLSPPKPVLNNKSNESNNSNTTQLSNTFLSTNSKSSSLENTFHSAHKSNTILEDDEKENSNEIKPRQFMNNKVIADKAFWLTSGNTAKVINTLLNSTLTQAWDNIRLSISPLDFSGSNPELQHHLSQLKEQTTEGIKSNLRYSTEIQSLVLQVDSQLVDYGNSLHKLIEVRRLSHQPLRDLTHLTSALHVKHYKLRFVELQILCSSYTPEIISNLRCLKSQLNQSTEEANSQLTILHHKLEPYKHLDPTYLALLDEYNKLRMDLKFCTATK